MLPRRFTLPIRWPGRVAAATLVILSITAFATPAHAGVGPRCYVSSSYGWNSNNLEPAEGNGPVVITAEADYADQYNTVPIDIYWFTTTGLKINTSNKTSKTTFGTITINGIKKKESQLDAPGRTDSPGYSVHGLVKAAWQDTAGNNHYLAKGDLVTWSFSVTYWGTTSAQTVNGQTTVSCRV